MTDSHKTPTTIVIEEQTQLTLTELCDVCGVQSEWIVDLVHEGVLTPTGESPQHWRFSGQHLRRATVAVRLRRDLDVNAAGAALALELLEELETLRTQLDTLSNESNKQ